MVNFYRKFIREAALILAPLTNPLKGPVKQLVWSSTMESAFLPAKHLLSTMPTLVYQAPGSALSVALDGSKFHAGAVLQQQMQGSWFPLAFYSRELNDAERKYSAFDRELPHPPFSLHA